MSHFDQFDFSFFRNFRPTEYACLLNYSEIINLTEIIKLLKKIHPLGEKPSPNF